MAKDALGHGSDSQGAASALSEGHPKSVGVSVHPAFAAAAAAQAAGALARWESPKGKWAADLIRETGGYHLSELKNGNPVGASFRPSADNPKIGYVGLHNDAEAIAHFENHVRNSFDVKMKRVK